MGFPFATMARVSQEHLDARRRQILEGAARCFARNGFHATSMQDVLKEVELSAAPAAGRPGRRGAHPR